ncbi:MAG: FecR domain-containing protein [Candidatus Thiodiazotropha sp. (ex Codakia orbicularis)]|nr:FecR domain-containing protein [Candidatus Thiodiazotropha sp. (ex Lucina pensylvanica)]MBT3050465.1 FecR domain-containing protein [Candidatus Thiodiazotropha sp. (ex Codakia orbicularis)]MBT3054953.1 FecR domain-containing protein [Candidatus Thiodiazotropha sp. (ex Codakia orbicularis)]
MQHCKQATMLAKFLFLIFILVFSQQLFSAECSHVAQVVSLEGSAEKKRDGQETWQQVVLDDQFCAGDAIRTLHDGRAAVRLTNDTLLRLDRDSALTFTQVGKTTPSLLDLLRGAVHFISRTPKSLEVKTPYVNASIEGTEFVIRIRNQGTEVTVLEGTVIAANEAGSIDLSANQATRASADQQPVRIEVVKPFEAVAWALYYPSLPEAPGKADTLAQKAIKAIVQNRLEEATELAKQALQQDSQSAAAYMAQSYVNQAMFDIPAALANSKKAAELAPQNALAQARLAEVWLMTGHTRSAREAANQAITINPELSLAHTVLGFASLRDINLNAAETAFEKAIALDSAAPLPHLGLGLLEIRQGALESGRERIETSVLLDPNNALLRSYMGKAYYEEKRNDLAYQQFALAKELDPNDPTAWFYDSILLQTDNRPVEALHAQLHAIELNDNRGVYRSRQLLDKDEASRNVALGRIYNDLSFEQQARYQATDALAQDPGNHSAHRLLADSYVGFSNLDAARQSELLQSKLTQPLNLDPLQPQLSNSNLGLLDGNGPEDLSYNEYNPLFTRNGLALQLDASVSENDTWSNDAIVAGLYNRFAFSIGQFHTEADEVRKNTNYEQDIINGFLQFALSPDTSIQLELSESEVEKGDVSQRLLPEFSNIDNVLVYNEITSSRIGLKQALTSSTQILLSVIRKEQDFNSQDSSDPFVFAETDRDRTIDLYEARFTNNNNNMTSWLAGISRQNEDLESVLDLTYQPPFSCPLPSCIFDSQRDLSQVRAYAYLNYETGPRLMLTGGATLIDEENEFDDDVKKVYPKLGIKYAPQIGSEIRVAAFRNRNSVVEPSLYETLEPTQILGFNQFYDGLDQTDSWNYAAAYNHRFSNNLHMGVSTLYRDLETKINILDLSTPFPSESRQSLEYNDKYANLWLNWTPNSQWGFGVEYSYNNYNLEEGLTAADSSILAPDGILKLETHKLPVSISHFHPSGIIGSLTTTYYNQKGNFIDLSGFMTESGDDNGLITDLILSYRFPSRRGIVSIGVKNLFDEELNFEDRNSYDAIDPTATSSPSSLTDERAVFGKISVNFR